MSGTLGPDIERAASGATRRRFADGRWHFQHGPIDCIVAAEGEPAVVMKAVESAWARFGGVLGELVSELPLLRADLGAPAGAAVAPRGPIARRMVAACRAHATNGRFITAMAAVAGSVAEELIAHFELPGIERAYVNNGGDIALHLASGAAFEIGIVADMGAALAAARTAVDTARTAAPIGVDAALTDAGKAVDSRLPAGRFRIEATSGVRGVATSGWRGRSLSFGIADSATVLAASASAADAAATVIANAVDVDDPRIRRAPADRLRDDSDLGARLVTCDVPVLPSALVDAALDAGLAVAEAECDAGRAVAAALWLQGRVRTTVARVAFDTLTASPCTDALAGPDASFSLSSARASRLAVRAAAHALPA